MPRRLLKPLHRNRDFLERASLALVLPFVAGLINAEGFFIVGVYTSHVTGTVAHAAEAVARGQFPVAFPALLLVLAFFTGAACATALVERTRDAIDHTGRARYASALGMEVLTLSAVTVLGLYTPVRSRGLQLITTVLLSFSMGAQNALVSKLSGAVVRNTHLTGIVTDLGIESVRAWRWFRATTRSLPLAGVLHVLTHLRAYPELRRLRLHAAIFGSFFAGAVIGPLMYLRDGYIAMLLPIAVLAALMIFDVGIGLRGNEPGAANTPGPANAVPPAT
ncbi:MAG TPA: YoaK family protein [Polyangia bacterium]